LVVAVVLADTELLLELREGALVLNRRLLLLRDLLIRLLLAAAVLVKLLDQLVCFQPSHLLAVAMVLEAPAGQFLVEALVVAHEEQGRVLPVLLDKVLLVVLMPLRFLLAAAVAQVKLVPIQALQAQAKAAMVYLRQLTALLQLGEVVAVAVQAHHKETVPPLAALAVVARA
jgi:hypothetical protein